MKWKSRAVLGLTLSALPLSIARAQPELETCPPSPHTETLSAPTKKPANALTPLNAAMREADTLATNGDLDGAKKIYLRLSQTPPEKTEAAVRARFRLANLARRAGSFDEAEGLVRDASAHAKNPELKQRAIQYLVDIDHDRRVSKAAAAYAAAQDLYEQRKLDEAEAALNALLSLPCPTPDNFYARIHLRLASIALARSDFANARKEAGFVSSDPDAPLATERRAVQQRIEEKEIDTAARAEYERGQGFYNSGDRKSARAVFSGMVDKKPPWPTEWTQAAEIRLAAIARRQEDYVQASALLTRLASGGPSTDDIRERLSKEQAALARSTQDAVLSGGWLIGARADSNAPAETAANYGEDELNPFPSSQKFSDEAVYYRASAAYQKGVNKRYDVVTLSGAIAGSEQSSLEQLDRFSIGGQLLYTRRVPSLQTNISPGVTYARTWRGGQFLNQDFGLSISATHAITERLRASLTYTGAKRDDTRNVYDAWRHSIRADLDSTPLTGWQWTVGVELRGDDAKTDALAIQAVTANFEVAHKLTRLGAWDLSGLAGAQYDYLWYQGPVTISGIAYDRTSERIRTHAGLQLASPANLAFQLELSTLDAQYNTPGADRSNTRIGFSVQQKY